FAADFIPGAALTFPPASPLRDAGLAVPNLTAGTRFAGPEDSEVFEIGLKAAFDRLAFNLTVFDQSIEGFQSNVFTGTGFSLRNAGERSTIGLEFDTTWQPTDQLTLGFAATLLDPTYDEFTDSGTGDISGTQPSGVSEQAFSTSAKYDFLLGAIDAFVRADWQYESETDYFDAIEPGSDFTDAQAVLGFGREINTVNASTGLVTPNGLGITLWGRNLFDDEYITTAFPSVAQDGSISGYPNQPATYGVTVRKEF
ncbi:MAG: TonB-dependent receptor, partial [Pseudomonadota bacterium]